METKQYKILMCCFPASGHVTPFVCYGAELAKNPNVKIIMYSHEQHQKLIESAGIEFRGGDLPVPTDKFTIHEIRKDFPIHKLLNYFIDGAENLLPKLLRCVQEEDIDMIIYDFMTVYAKWLVKRLRVLHQKGELKRPVPKAMTFLPSLAHEKGIYPNSLEEKTLLPQPKFSVKMTFFLFVFFLRYLRFCFKYGFTMTNPFELIFEQREPFTICCIAPEFQPRSHMFSSGTKFVGNCAVEQLRGESELSEPLKSFLAPFPERNPLPLVNLRVQESKLKADCELIYVSLGTVVNTEVEPFLRLIDGIKAINKFTPDDRYKFLMSVGNQSHANLQAMIASNKLQIPTNLLIMPRVPQLDVLKRASLFITHSGQGGASEAIHYGVPMVCIPVMGDQNEVAYRTADELGLGIRLDFDTFDAESLRKACSTVLGDKSYLERTILFSQISRKYNGTKEANRITLEFLQSTPKIKSS